MSGNFAIKGGGGGGGGGGGVGRLMANAILNFHFDYLKPSLRTPLEFSRGPGNIQDPGIFQGAWKFPGPENFQASWKIPGAAKSSGPWKFPGPWGPVKKTPCIYKQDHQ